MSVTINPTQQELRALLASFPERYDQEFDGECFLSTDEAKLLVAAYPALLDHIERLEAENRKHDENWRYLWRWVERGLFDSHTSPKDALEVMAHYPAAPWFNIKWDVTHKPYADAFYAKFPKARLALNQEQEQG
jgi:hypothetical protein